MPLCCFWLKSLQKCFLLSVTVMSISHPKILTFSNSVWNPLFFLLTFTTPLLHFPSYVSAVLTSFSPSLPSFITPHSLVTVHYLLYMFNDLLHNRPTVCIYFLAFPFLYLCCIILSIHSALSLSFCPSPALPPSLPRSLHPSLSFAAVSF